MVDLESLNCRSSVCSSLSYVLALWLVGSNCFHVRAFYDCASDGRVMAGRSFIDRFELLFISATRIRLRIEYVLSELILYLSFFHFFSLVSSSSCCQALYNFLCLFSVCFYASVSTFFFNSLPPSFSFTVGLYPCRFLCLVFYLYLYLCADIFH